MTVDVVGLKRNRYISGSKIVETSEIGETRDFQAASNFTFDEKKAIQMYFKHDRPEDTQVFSQY